MYTTHYARELAIALPRPPAHGERVTLRPPGVPQCGEGQGRNRSPMGLQLGFAFRWKCTKESPNLSSSSFTVPIGGELAGQPMRILPWQAEFLRRWCATESDFGLSVARGAGKTALIAAVAACVIHPLAPLFREGSEVVVLIGEPQSGRIAGSDVRHYLLSAGIEPSELRTWNNQSHAMIEHRPSKATMLCLGSSPERLHSRRPRLVIIDELSAFKERAAEEALAIAGTSLGKIPGSRLLVISTMPTSAAHPFADFLKRLGKRGSLIYRSTSTTLAGARRANPSLPYFPELAKRVKIELAESRKDAAALQAFKALRLNMGGSLSGGTGALISPADWAACAIDDTAQP